MAVRRWLLVGLLGLACQQAGPPAPARCGPEAFGVPAYDALLRLPGEGRVPAIFLTGDPAVRLGPAGLGRLRAALDEAARADPALVPPRLRVALQNDVWGLWQRLGEGTIDSSEREAARAAAGRLVRRLALPARLLEALARAEPVPRSIGRVLSTGSGFREVGTEHTVLTHERLFGLRRLFRLYEAPRRRALASQLVALDADGRPVLAPVAGEIEALVYDGDRPAAALVWHLDRRALRCGDPVPLREESAVGHVPDLGANGFLLEADPPALLTDLPCAARCHRGATPMSLPLPEADPAPRQTRLLAELGALPHP